MGKMDEVIKGDLVLMSRVQNIMEVNLKTVNKRMGQFAAPI
jgi:hypothetical protein